MLHLLVRGPVPCFNRAVGKKGMPKFMSNRITHSGGWSLRVELDLESSVRPAGCSGVHNGFRRKYLHAAHFRKSERIIRRPAPATLNSIKDQPSRAADDGIDRIWFIQSQNRWVTPFLLL